MLCISRDITERNRIEAEHRQAEEKLRESEQRYRAIINQAVTGVAYSDLGGKLTLVNQKYCDITGYSATELSQLRMHEITHAEDLPRNLELYNRMLADGTPFEIEKRYIRKDGSIIWVNNHVSTIRDHQGKPQSVIAIVLDITDRKQAEAALREAQESLTIAVEAAQMGTWHLDLTKDVSAKRSLRHDQIFGYDTLQSEWGQQIAKRHVVAEDHEIFDTAFARAMETGDLDFEVRIQWSDGSIHWMAVRGRFYFDEEGKPTSGGGVNFDITHRKQVEAQLRESEAKYRTLFNLMDEGFCLIEVLFDETGKAFDYRFLEANLAFEKHTGLLNTVGKTIRELVPQHGAQWFEIYGEIVQTGVPARFENVAEELGRFYDVYAFRVGEPHECKVAVLFSDITERKQTELNAQFMATVTQGLVGSTDVDEMIQIVGEQLHRYLKTSICAFIEINERADEAILNYVWRQENMADLRGIYSLPEFVSKEFLQASQSGHTIVVRDVYSDPQITDRERFAALKISSFINIPLIRDNEWKFTLGVYHQDPYNWRNDEIELMYELANRIWTKLERVRAETALRASEERYRTLFNSMDEGYVLADVIFDKQDRPVDIFYLEANPAVLRLTGLELAGHSLRELNANYEAYWWETFGRVAQTGMGERQEFYAQPLKAWYNFYVFKAGDANSRRVAAVFQDVTRRKNFEQERERFLAIGSDLQVITGLQGYFLWVSPTFERTLGWSPAEMTSRPWADFVHPDDLNNSVLETESLFSGNTTLAFENRYRHKNGSYRWFLWRAQPYPEEQVIYGVAVDITERKQAEAEREQLLAKERHYAKQLQGLTNAALAINSALSVEEVLQVITDQAVSIIEVHQAVTSLVINQNWAQALNAIYLSDKYAAWQNSTEEPDGSGIYGYVCHLNHPIRLTQAELEAHPHWNGFSHATDRHPPLRGWLAAPLVGRDGDNIGLIQLSDKSEGDFTEADESILVQLAQMASVAIENARLYEAEQQVRSTAEASREEAQVANRVKDEFLAVLSHELRSPLNPILGWSKLLQTGKLDAARSQQALKTIERNAQLQSELIEDLLDVSRILQGKLSLNISSVNLVSVIQAAMETIRLAAEAKSISLEASLNPDVGRVWGDPTRLQQVIWNLLSNAVKFTPEGGQVTIRLERLDSHAYIRVSDTGQGITPAFLPYVFDYFRQANATTTRKFGGLGLGLAIVRHLVELHGGTVGVESPGEGQGATFFVSLPVVPTPLKARPNTLTPELSLDLNGFKILVVDDETDTRELVAFILEQEGAQVIGATSAHEALLMLTQVKPDLLLSDIGMPDMDGYMLIQQVRQLAPEQGGQIPAIALTAYAGEMNQQQVMAAGFQKHLSKPFEPELLIQTIVRLVRPL